MKDIFVACFDDLKGVPEAIEPVFPDTQVQLCIVHMGQHSQNYVSWKQRNEIATDLKAIYTANAIESVNMSLRKVMKNRTAFPNDESMIKLMYLALQDLSKKWTVPIRNCDRH